MGRKKRSLKYFVDVQQNKIVFSSTLKFRSLLDKEVKDILLFLVKQYYDKSNLVYDNSIEDNIDMDKCCIYLHSSNININDIQISINRDNVRVRGGTKDYRNIIKINCKNYITGNWRDCSHYVIGNTIYLDSFINSVRDSINSCNNTYNHCLYNRYSKGWLDTFVDSIQDNIDYSDWSNKIWVGKEYRYDMSNSYGFSNYLKDIGEYKDYDENTHIYKLYLNNFSLNDIKKFYTFIRGMTVPHLQGSY